MEKSSADLQMCFHNWRLINTENRLKVVEEKKRSALEKCLLMHGKFANHKNTAFYYHSLGVTLKDQSKYTEAEGCFRKALNMRLNVDGSKIGNDISISFHWLGITLQALNRYHEAEECKRKSLNMFLNIFGSANNTVIAGSYHSLGVTLHSLNRYDEAEDCLRKALDMIQISYGKTDNADIAKCYLNLGTTLHSLGKYSEAEECKWKALNMRMNLCGRTCSHYDVARCLRSLAETQNALEKISEALKCEKKASDMEASEDIKHDDKDLFSDGEEIFSTVDKGKRYIELNLGLCDLEMKSAFISPKVYKMSKVTRGRCLIINNMTFIHGSNKQSKRTGSDIDARNLEILFLKLRFDVIVKQNVESHMLTQEVLSEVNNPDQQTYGMFVLVIMTHGSYGVLYGSDIIPVRRHDILQGLYDSEYLMGKPKLVIIQACSGDRRTRYQYDGTPAVYQLNAKISAPPDDVVLLTSAFDGFLSVRDAEFGSPFIRALTEALYKHAHHWHIKKIYEQVAHKLRIAHFPPPAMVSFLSKKLYLFPNYDGE